MSMGIPKHKVEKKSRFLEGMHIVCVCVWKKTVVCVWVCVKGIGNEMNE